MWYSPRGIGIEKHMRLNFARDMNGFLSMPASLCNFSRDRSRNVSNAPFSVAYSRIERGAPLSIASVSPVPGTSSWFKVHPDPDAGRNSARTLAESRSIGFARLTESTVRAGAAFRCEFSFAKLFVRLVDMELYWPPAHRCVRGRAITKPSNLRSLPSRKAALPSPVPEARRLLLAMEGEMRADWRECLGGRDKKIVRFIVPLKSEKHRSFSVYGLRLSADYKERSRVKDPYRCLSRFSNDLSRSNDISLTKADISRWRERVSDFFVALRRYVPKRDCFLRSRLI